MSPLRLLPQLRDLVLNPRAEASPQGARQPLAVFPRRRSHIPCHALHPRGWCAQSPGALHGSMSPGVCATGICSVSHGCQGLTGLLCSFASIGTRLDLEDGSRCAVAGQHPTRIVPGVDVMALPRPQGGTDEHCAYFQAPDTRLFRESEAGVARRRSIATRAPLPALAPRWFDYIHGDDHEMKVDLPGLLGDVHSTPVRMAAGAPTHLMVHGLSAVFMRDPSVHQADGAHLRILAQISRRVGLIGIDDPA
ncbi:hypothetical protein FB451DRAFT_1396681 [Mycena latifolia]|nr:hypothetical protein FB451DRAFT_1396681 [Mycena latifolia]